MAINSVLQTIRNAEIDARSLSEFVSKGHSFTVTRRLAPTIHTLDYYLLVLNSVKEKGDLADIAISDTLDKLDQLEPTIIQRVESAISNTAVDGGVLSDALVVVDDSINQRQINRGLESIADLSTINNPKDGLRVYVKSYHAGLGKGGGYFTYDSSKLNINDGGTIINGWCRDTTSNKELDIYSFGVVGDGEEDDTTAITNASNVLNVVDLKGKIFKVSSIPVASFVNGGLKVNNISTHFSATKTIEKSAIRVATWNIWGANSASYYFKGDRLSPDRVAKLKVRFIQWDFDIVGLQEVYFSPTLLPHTAYLIPPLISAGEATAINRGGGLSYGNLTLSTKVIESSTSVVYADKATGSDSDKEDRSYLNTVYNINNKSVSVYNTHLSYLTRRNEAMVAELVEAVLLDTSDVIFVMGDFNTNNWSLFSGLLSAGFKQVNNNTIDTKPGSGSWYIDEIFYKGASIEGVPGIYEDAILGDHSALYADFII